MLQLLAATTNAHKVQEFKDMLGDMAARISFVMIQDIPNFPELIEDGNTFEENSCMKAVQASRYADMAAFADDSGLEVRALKGAPGVYSARYAGPGATDQDRINKLLDEIKGVRNRTARFVSVISLAYRGNVVGTFKGVVRGRISVEPRGKSGFGYDPVFIPEGYDKTFAELGPEVKDKISHRAKAFAQAAEFVRNELATMDDFEFV